MARYYSKRFSNKRFSKRPFVERLAYQLGKVNRGLDNPDSLISQSFINGMDYAERKKVRKTLY